MKLTKAKNKKIVIYIITLIVLIIGVCVGFSDKQELYEFLGIENLIGVSNTNQNNVETGEYKVVRVVDGDTIVIDYNGKEEKLRLIGVDTPESVHPDSSENTEERRDSIQLY